MPHEPFESGNVSRHILPESGNASRLRSVITIILPIVTSVALLGAAPLWWHPLARIFDGSSAAGRVADSPAHGARPSTSVPSVAPSVHTSSAPYYAPAPVNPPPTPVAVSNPTSPVPRRIFNYPRLWEDSGHADRWRPAHRSSPFSWAENRSRGHGSSNLRLRGDGFRLRWLPAHRPGRQPHIFRHRSVVR
jgi:hypothetical protein